VLQLWTPDRMTKSRREKSGRPNPSALRGALLPAARILCYLFHVWSSVLRVERFGKYSDSCATPKYFFGTVVPPGTGPRKFVGYARKCLHRKRFGNFGETLDGVGHVPLRDALSVFPKSVEFLFSRRRNVSIMTIHKLLFRMWNTVDRER